MPEQQQPPQQNNQQTKANNHVLGSECQMCQTDRGAPAAAHGQKRPQDSTTNKSAKVARVLTRARKYIFFTFLFAPFHH